MVQSVDATGHFFRYIVDLPSKLDLELGTG